MVCLTEKLANTAGNARSRQRINLFYLFYLQLIIVIRFCGTKRQKLRMLQSEMVSSEVALPK